MQLYNLGITLGGRAAGSLTEKTILALTNYYRTSILRFSSDVEKMRNDILATLCHCSSTDKASDHSLCPKGNIFIQKYIRTKQIYMCIY